MSEPISLPCDPGQAFVRRDPKTGAMSVCANFVFPCGGSLSGWVPYALAKDWMTKACRLGKRPDYFQPAPVFKCGFRHRHLKDCPWIKAIWEGDETPSYVAYEEQGFWGRLVDKARIKNRLRPCAGVHDLKGQSGSAPDDGPVKPNDDLPVRLEPQKNEGAAEGAERGCRGGDGCDCGGVHAAES